MAFLNINPDLFLGSQELNRLIKFLDQDGFRKLFLQNSVNFGLINNSFSGQFSNFQVTLGTNVGTIKINEGIAIDNAGEIATYPTTDNIALTDNSLWYWITAEYVSDIREIGVCSIDGNGNLFFAGGELTKILRGLPNNPVKIEFTNASINTGEYEVVEVIDNENAVIAGDFLPETNLRLSVVGAFTPDVVPPGGSKNPFRYNGSTITITLESVANTPPALVAGKQFTLARVQRTGASVVIQDKRGRNIYQTKADGEIATLALSNNPLVGVEAVKFDNVNTPKDHNLVHIAWTFRSSNWTIDSGANRVTLIAGQGGKFKDTTYFTDGDFDGWRLYTKGGKFVTIKQSTKVATQINLILETLDPDNFSDTLQELVVAPNADEIEFTFAADPTDNTDLPSRSFALHINRGKAIIPIVAYKSPFGSYNVKYRYKSLKVWSELTPIPSDPVGYFVEADFDNNGVQVASARQTYVSSTTAGFILLNLAPSAFVNRIAGVETGDLYGVQYRALDNALPVQNLIVGTDKQYQVITNDDNLNESDPDFGVAYPFTIDHFINLSTITPTTLQNGNNFTLQFRGVYTPGAFSLTITQDYVNPGNTGWNLYTFSSEDFAAAAIDELLINCTFDGTRWFIKEISPKSSGEVPSVRILTAGNGLSGGGDLSADRTFTVNVDGSTIEINADTLRVKALGITNTQLATGVVVTHLGYTPANAARNLTAGAGLGGGGDLSADRTFDVNVDGTTIEINADTLRIKPIEAWSNLTYTSPWTTQNFQAKYRKNVQGEVALTGEVWTNGAATTGGTLVIGTLPVGYRPATELTYPLNYFNASIRKLGTITIQTDGDIVWGSTIGEVVSSTNLDHIRFYTD